jgi:dTDP-4-dehydrorhamnose 3,5-epimerase
MRFSPTPIAGAWLIEADRNVDERGWFGRTFCAREFADHGLDPTVAQSSASFNRRRGTVRGMHWQAPPSSEAKLVRVTRGAICDVIVDLHTLHSFGVELSAAEGIALYIPPGCAHGFQTLVDDTEVSYQMNEYFDPAAARGARWDDPAFDVRWPLPVSVIAERDREWPPYAQPIAAPPPVG